MNRNLISYVSSNLLIKFFVFASQLLVAFIISPKELGEIKTSQGIIEVLSLLACIGLNASTLAFAPKIKCAEEREKLYQKVSNSTLFVSLVLTSALLVIYLLFDDYMNESLSLTLIKMTPLLIFTSLTTQLICFIQSEHRFDKLAKGQLLAKVVSIPVLLAFTYILGVDGYILALYLAAFLTILILFRAISFKLSFQTFTKTEFYTQWKVAKGALLSNVLGTFTFYVGLFVLNFISEKSEMIGNYSFAIIIVSGFEVISRSVQQYFIPFFSSSNSRDELELIENKCVKYAFLISVLSIIVLAVVYFSKFEFKYYESIPFLIGLIISWFFSIKFILKAGYFIATGNTMLNFKASCLQTVLTIMLSMTLGYSFGVYGIVLAKILTVCISISIYRYLYENCS